MPDMSDTAANSAQESGLVPRAMDARGRGQAHFAMARCPGGPVKYVVPKGKEHKSCAAAEAKMLLIEPRGVPYTGNSGGARAAQNDVWI